MKVTLKDFGPISHFEFDLEKDLHVIFGKNNVGKSYSITAIYLILKHISDSADYFSTTITSHINSSIIKFDEDKIINEIIQNRDNNTDITTKTATTFRAIIELFFQRVGQSFNNSFPPFSLLVNTHSKKEPSIELHYHYFTIYISTNPNLNVLYIKDVILNYPIVCRRRDDKRLVLSNDTALHYNTTSIIDYSKIIETFYTSFEDEVAEKINAVYFLPASRSGLYQGLSAFSSIVAELSRNRHLLTSKVELPSLSEPVSDYFLNLSNIDNSSKNEFSDIIENIEREILKGEILFNNETKKIAFKETGVNELLDLSFSSSMVSEIAPIVAYLKYIITSENKSMYSMLLKKPSESFGLLFIEEPEAHLHPEVQVKLMEMFVLLAGKNVKIVMTSHSNYMFNKLSNLLLENKIDHNKVSSYLMRATDIGSVTDMLSMKAEEDGMNDENFADTAAMLYDERIKIYEKLNKEAKNAD